MNSPLDKTGSPPGPEQPIDFNIDDDTFNTIPALFAEYGDIVKVASNVRKSDTYLLNRVEDIKRVLVNNNRNYDKGYGFERVKILLGNSIIASNGAFWRSQRLMVQPAFHKSVLERLTGLMHEVNVTLLDDWLLKAKTGESIDITTVTNRLALEVVLRGIFSDDYDWVMARCDLMALLADNAVRDLQLAVKFRELRKILQSLVDTRRANIESTASETGDRYDLLAMLMQARDRDGQPMQDRHLIDEVVTLIVAGNETTASTMNWTWYLLSQYPEAEQRVIAEADALTSDAPGFADLPALKYTKQVINEALRLYPPGWLFSRKAIAEDQLSGFTIPAGADILISPYYLHRNERYWENPDQFDPDRFSETRFTDAQKFAFLPFSAGPRRCIGDQFAMVEMQIHFAYMLRRIKLRYIPEQPIQLEPAINLRTLHNLRMAVEVRDNSDS